MSSIFICYRREDSSAHAGRLFDHLIQHFGPDRVFMDVDGIRPGDDFVERLKRMVGACQAMLAVIGKDWLMVPAGKNVPRLMEVNDYVRVEIATALRRKIRVIPVLVSGATMPDARHLPDDLKLLANHQAVELRDSSFSNSLVPLLSALRAIAAAPAQLEDPRFVERPVNLSFDGAKDANFPYGWFDSSGMVSGVSLDYAVSVVRRNDIAGNCLRLQSVSSQPGQFGSVMQRFPAVYLAGHTIKLQGEIRTEAVAEWAGLWLRADGEEETGLFFDNMSGQGLSATTGWKTYALEGRLPSATTWLNIGAVLSGSGTVWVDNIRLMMWIGSDWTDV